MNKLRNWPITTAANNPASLTGVVMDDCSGVIYKCPFESTEGLTKIEKEIQFKVFAHVAQHMTSQPC